MSQDNIGAYQLNLTSWDPGKCLSVVQSQEVRLSRGFLRSRPDKWFPGFAAQWLPLAHALGCSLKIVEVKPLMEYSFDASECFAAKIDDQHMVVMAEPLSAQTLTDVILPGVGTEESSLLLEYLARRLIFTLANSWTGPRLGKVSFVGLGQSCDISGAVKLLFYLDDRPCTVWIGLGAGLIESLDGLWRRQVQSVTRSPGKSVNIELEIAQIAIPLTGLAEHLKRGAVIDLGVVVSDFVTMRCNNRPWLPGRLCQIDGVFGVETTRGPVGTATIPDGSTRLSIELGSFSVEPGVLSELAQVGALCSSDIPVSNKVKLLINHEKVADGTLSTLGNRFVLVVE